MNLSDGILLGYMGAFYQMGIDMKKYDKTNNIIYLDIPKKSYNYEKPEAKIKNAEQQAIRLQETIGKIYPNIRIRFKEKDVYWTKEMSDMNYERNKDKIIDGTLWDNVIVC